MIPKVIHQIWFGDKSLRPASLMDSWRTLHPGWKYILWTESNLFPLANQFQFDLASTNYPAKSDIARYEILYRYGGFYLDADSLCLKSITPLCSIDSIVAAREGAPNLPNLVANGTIGCTSSHPVMRSLIESISLLKKPFTRRQTWKLTGPVIFSTILLKWANKTILPANSFYPFHHTDTIKIPLDLSDPRFASSYAVQFWGSTFAHRYEKLKTYGSS